MLPKGGGVSNHPLEDFQKYRSWALTSGDSDLTDEKRCLGIIVCGLSPGDSATAILAKSGAGDHCPGASHVSAPGTGHMRWLSQKCPGSLSLSRKIALLKLFLVGRKEWELLTSSSSWLGGKHTFFVATVAQALQVMTSQ